MLIVPAARPALTLCFTANRFQCSRVCFHRVLSDWADRRSADRPSSARPSFAARSIPRRYDPQQSRQDEVSDGLTYLYGANAVLAALRSKKRMLYTLYIAEAQRESSTAKSILAAARKSNLEIIQKSRNELDRLSNGKPHNNAVLSCSELPRLGVQALGNEEQGWKPVLVNEDSMQTDVSLASVEHDKVPVYVLLDEVTDPHNMGSIIRSAYFLGCAGIILSARNCCSITPAVAKVSSGASEFMPIYHADSVVSLIKQSRKQGWRCIATVGREEAALLRTKRQLTELKSLAKNKKQPILLVLGNEGSGLRTNVKMVCSTLTSIASPSRIDSSVESLNVGVAAAILLHQLLG